MSLVDDQVAAAGAGSANEKLARMQHAQQQAGMLRAVPPEEVAYGNLMRHGFAVLHLDGSPPILLTRPDRVLATVLR